jgi:hypothetical protein
VRPRPNPNPYNPDDCPGPRPRPRPRPDVSPDTNPDRPSPQNDRQQLEQFRRQVANYPQWDATRYQAAVSTAFDRVVTNNNDYMASLYEAASQNKPVVMLIGKGSDPASRQVIENSMRQLHARSGRDALCVFVDMDRVDRNSAIGKYAFENMPRKGQEPPFTMVFGLSRGDAANPVKADGPSFYRMGPVEGNGAAEAVSRLKLQMEGRFNLPRPDVSPRPDLPPRPDVNPNPNQIDPRIQEAFAKALVQAQSQTDKESSYKAYKQAVDIADSARNPLLQSAARVELGLACIRWGFKETGFKWIMDGGAKNPDLYNNQKNAPFRNRLEQAGIPHNAVEMLIQSGQRDPNWHMKYPDAGKMLETAMNRSYVPDEPHPVVPQPPRPGYPQPVPDRTTPAPHLRPSPFR